MNDLEILREFAGQAMVGIMHSENDFDEEKARREDWDGFCQWIAESAFDYADAMLAEYKNRYEVK